MDYEQEALDLIARPENIGAALEIARLVDHMRPRFQKVFWQAVTVKAESFLLASDLAESWRLWSSQNYRASYAGLIILPKEIESGQRHLRIKLEQGKKGEDYPLYYGLHWDRSFPEWKQMPILRPLRDALIAQGLGGDNNWWIGYKYIGTYIYRQEFLLRMGTDQEALVEEMASLLFELLETNVHEIEAINTALSQPPHLSP